MIEPEEILFYKSQTVSEAGGNGGRMSANEITDGAAQNVFPTVGQSERIAGSLKWRKVFIKVANDDDLALAEPKVILDRYTLGEDIVTFIAATQTNTQADIVGDETEYGAGKLDANVIATATEIDVLVEDGGDHTFEDGAKIRISDKPSVGEAGNEEFVTIDGAPSVAGDVVTLTITPALANGYSASTTYVQRVYEPGADVEATIDNVVVTSDDGTVDEAFILGDAIGAIDQTITLTFTSATAFNGVSDVLGSLGAGSVGAGFAPVNGSFSKPYVVIQAAAFGGTFVAGDTVVLHTNPASVPVFMKRNVPAGAAAFTVNTTVLALIGESAAS